MILFLAVVAILFAFFFYAAATPLYLAIAIAVLASIAALQTWYDAAPNGVFSGQLNQFKNLPTIVKFLITAIAILIPVFASKIS